ncbi:hypothetical protein IE53DRAFT_360421 [Violaceomyces palustris]|uniref:Uncharacterized protein n=1 Tax=Violaceomyces palustris TaxID=1673888 RepID=A0ACD0P469_9BASI|nr:hypothetical protein IE53DRAFT_360421 [Violaceomyces palustris]
MDEDHNDIERQGAGYHRNQAAASAFSNLEGRSYRFSNVAHDAMSQGTSVVPGSYTATLHSIRDSTAQLADMALMSDDESNNGNNSHIFDQSFGDEIDGRRLNSPSVSGPSNLSKALLASQGSSPEDGRTIAGSQQGTPRVSDMFDMSKLDEGSLQSGPDETTRLLADTAEESDQVAAEIPRRGRPTNDVRSAPESKRGRSRSSSQRDPFKRPNGSGFESFYGERPVGGSSGFSHLGEDRPRTTYGYGALAQAEHSALDHGSGLQAYGRAGSLPYEEEEEYLSPAWNLVPKKFRPGQGTVPTKHFKTPSERFRPLVQSIRKLTWQTALDASAEPVRLLPAVILGMLMNVLDGVSYGMIMFPASYPIFSSFGGDGVSMFFVTCIMSQLVYTLGGSVFKGGNGSMMIEVVPFFHILVKIIIDELGDENPSAIIATTMAAFALSSVLTGLAFLSLGALRLGVLIGFFPRHILVGCIGGVGIFLIETGLEVCGRLKSEEGFQYNLETLRFFFQSGHMVSLWLPPLCLAILLRLITTKFHHPLVFPGYFLAIPPIFYLVAVGILRVPMSTLRDDGWVFDIGEASNAPFYRFYSYFDFSQTSFKALWATMPTQLALVFFGILHVPLNVPALGVSINEDNVDTDRELVAHGITNLLAGLTGTVPNYLCYVNSVLFYRVGGGSRLSGIMLAIGTFFIMIAGPGCIGFLPVMIVGALIFVLGIDLAKEALYDTVGRVNGWEYFTIWVIVVVMTYWDFVIGILAGIIIACCFFVVQTSRRKTVRSIFDGSIARSTVRRHMTQRRFLEAVGTQTQILKLQGFLFFGTINSVENLIRRALDIAAWHHNPIRFLLVDFTLVNGLDFSAAEAFTRINRLLAAKDVVLVFCGLTPESDVGVALRSVDLWADTTERLEVFENLNQALEWTENEYLRGMYASGLMAAKAFGQASLAAAGGLDVPDKKRKPAFVINESFENSPRRHHLHEAAKTAVQTGAPSPEQSAPTTPSPARPPFVQPLPILMITFRAYLDPDTNEEEFFSQLVPYFKQVRLSRGEVLWENGDEPDGLYLIESGILKARYDFPQEQYEINEAMLAGTIAGELTFLSRKERNTTVHAELDSTLWKLDTDNLDKLEMEKPAVFGDFIKVLLRVTGEEQENLMSYLVSRLS